MTSHRQSPLRGQLRIAALAATLALLVACATTPVVPRRGAADIARGPYVSFDERGNPTVDVTSDAIEQLALVAEVNGKKQTIPFQSVGGYRARATIQTDAPAGTKIPYAIARDGKEGPRHELKVVRKDRDGTITFCALGDSGISDGNKACKAQMSVAKVIEDCEPDLVVHTGDLIYPAGEAENYDPLFFAPYAKTLARVPFFVALGNHDIKTEDGKPALDALPYPGDKPAGRKYFSFDAGPVHFVALDSNPIEKNKVPFDQSEQGKWFRADVAQSTAPWKVVYFHHPLYSIKKERAGQRYSMQRGLEQALLDAKVDLVLNGHDHFYHRTRRVLSGARNDGGLIHVLTGGGGAGLYDGDPDPNGITASFHKKHNAVHAKFEPRKATIQALAPGDQGPIVLDSFELTK